MVKAAAKAYKEFPTVVNEVGESSLSYDNTMSDYARMDSAMQSAQKAIGGSSDTAQLSQSYYWSKVALDELDEECQQYYENTVILAVAAQLAIDGCKRVFEVDVNNDIARIRNQPCMKKKKDYPAFMKWTHEIKMTKNGKERPQQDVDKERNRVVNRVDESIICPMNWLIDRLNKIQGASKRETIDDVEFLVKQEKHANWTQVQKVRELVEKYDGYVKYCMSINDEEIRNLYYIEKTEETMEELRKLNISHQTMRRLIASSLGYEGKTKKKYIYSKASRYTIKMLNLLYKYDKQKFLKCFIKQG